tara:strand:+ start:1437 stop:2087 length:651 start_codon:yes stop_codon:yes gene_type:complete
MGLKTEDWIGIMGSIGTIMEARKKDRDARANQPLVQIYDPDSGTMKYVPRSEAVNKSTSQSDAEKYQKEANDALELFTSIYTDVDITTEAQNLIGKIDSKAGYELFDDFLKSKNPNKDLTDTQKKQRDIDLFEFRRMNSILTEGVNLSVGTDGAVIGSDISITEEQRVEYEAKRKRLQEKLKNDFGIDVDYIDRGATGSTAQTVSYLPKAYTKNPT